MHIENGAEGIVKMSWNYSDNEFIKIYRKMLNWEWYTDVNTKTLFLHCLLKANWKDGSWHGHEYKRGQFITSLQSLAKETGLSIRQVRTALKHLQTTGEVTSKKYAKFSVITVNSYDSFQSSDKQNDKKVTGKRQATRQASDKQVTTDIRTYKNNKEVKKEMEALPPDDDDIVTDFKKFCEEDDDDDW